MVKSKKATQRRPNSTVPSQTHIFKRGISIFTSRRGFPVKHAPPPRGSPNGAVCQGSRSGARQRRVRPGKSCDCQGGIGETRYWLSCKCLKLGGDELVVRSGQNGSTTLGMGLEAVEADSIGRSSSPHQVTASPRLIPENPFP